MRYIRNTKPMRTDTKQTTENHSGYGATSMNQNEAFLDPAESLKIAVSGGISPAVPVATPDDPGRIAKALLRLLRRQPADLMDSIEITTSATEFRLAIQQLRLAGRRLERGEDGKWRLLPRKKKTRAAPPFFSNGPVARQVAPETPIYPEGYPTAGAKQSPPVGGPRGL